MKLPISSPCRTVLEPQDFFSRIEEKTGSRVINLRDIVTAEVVLIIGEGQDLRFQVETSKCTKTFVIISPEKRYEGSVNLNFLKSEHVSVNIVGIQGSVDVMNAANVRTSNNKGMISIRKRGCSYSKKYIDK